MARSRCRASLSLPTNRPTIFYASKSDGQKSSLTNKQHRSLVLGRKGPHLTWKASGLGNQTRSWVTVRRPILDAFWGGILIFYYLQMISVSVRHLDITDPLFSLFAVFLFAVGLGPCQETCCCFLVRSGGPVVMADLESQPSSFLQFRFLVLQYC